MLPICPSHPFTPSKHFSKTILHNFHKSSFCIYIDVNKRRGEKKAHGKTIFFCENLFRDFECYVWVWGVLASIQCFVMHAVFNPITKCKSRLSRFTTASISFFFALRLFVHGLKLNRLLPLSDHILFISLPCYFTTNSIYGRHFLKKKS